ncbi:helix-turn-helix domain-containing protein [Streptomyces venetus]|uniref:AlbA family DNA-binding domain-containing protein n=1 Tax=Streptomyces venetus TaxID=1701086 RepID=UPI003C2D1FF7
MVTPLFAASMADLTIERIRALAARPDQVESQTLEFKREYSSSLLKSIAAMANTYGGMILVGVNDRAADGEDRVVGVDAQSVLDQIVSGCYEKFDPPWEPKFISVPLDDGSGLSVIVIKVDPNAAPRPLLMDMKAPIRLSGRNASADRDRLLALAREDRLADAVPMGQHVTSPQIPQDNEGSPTADFIFRTGINVPIGEAAAWRPLSERTLATLTQALNNAPLPRALLGICHGAADGFHPFRRAGFNRSRRARLAWHAGSKEPAGFPVEAVVTVALPDAHAVNHGVAQVQIDVISRLRRFAASLEAHKFDYLYPVPDLCGLLEGIVGTIVDPAVVAALADLADVEEVLVSQPQQLHLATGDAVVSLLHPEGLAPVPDDTSGSHGGIFIANPALDLRMESERREQVDNWMQQLGLDAGLIGMEELIDRVRATPSDNVPAR